MAISTYKAFLMHKNGASFEKLLDIKDFPDMGSAPEMLETTTLSNSMQTYIEGIQSSDALTFTANYTADDYSKVLDLKGAEEEFALWLGGTETGGVPTPTGSMGEWKFKGYISTYLNGGGVNEVIGMTVSIAPSTEIVFAESAS